jgi:hypothetical protein
VFAVAAAVLVLVVLLSPRRSPSRVRASRARVTQRGEVAREPSPHGPALQFADTYLEFLYSRASATAVTPITSALRAGLAGRRSLATPAELRRQLSVRDVQVTPTGPRSATARAIVDDGASPPYTLSFNLRLIAERWLVTGVGGGQ